MVVLPEPVAPTIAKLCPACSSNETSLRIQSSAAGSYLKNTLRNSIAPPRLVTGRLRCGPPVGSPGTANSSKMRSDAAMALCNRA